MKLTQMISRSHTPALVKGIFLSLGIALLALLIAEQPLFKSLAVSSLTLSIIVGIVLGNSIFPKIARQTGDGVDFTRNYLLRLGVILFGFKVTFQQIIDIGLMGLFIDIIIVISVFSTAYLLGTRLLKLDKETSILIGAGSSICGAAAILATEPLIKAQAHKISVAIATVVVFGTLSMFLYPVLYPYLHLSDHLYGIYVGSTVHEVAQVAGAGMAISEEAAKSAIIEKMLRVMMLVPFLFFIASFVIRTRPGGEIGNPSGISVPWFAILFVVMAGINSLAIVPNQIVHSLIWLDNLLLTMAMGALGLRTHLSTVKQAGFKPLVLALILFLLLTIGGYLINVLFMHGVMLS